MRRTLRCLRDRRGNTVIEFAMVAPVMMLTLMGLGDLMYHGYAQSILDGAVQKAGRDSGIQGGAQAAATIDGKVVTMMDSIMKAPVQACPAVASSTPTWCSTRESYTTFAQMAPEPFTDTNGNGKRDPGECYSDINGNKQWDADPGNVGQGGANDAVLYTMTLTYPRVFPVAGFLGMPSTQTISSKTILKNQPYATQTANTPATICLP